MEAATTDQDVVGSMEDLMSTSATSSTNGGDANGCGRKTSITSPDPTSYVAKARVTRPTPPPPSKNPMQFVQIKPCNLYQTAQQQLKKAEEVKKLKEVKKEEPEEWQNNLDNWKSSRRKRVEHIIDRAVETKKLELEEHDRMRRKSKTFTEMMEERAERGGSRGRNKLASLAVYNEDEANDFSDLGIGTSSASGKSSLSEDYDNNSVMSDHAAELDKAIGAAGSAAATAASAVAKTKSSSIEEQQNHINRNGNAAGAPSSNGDSSKAAAAREYISSPGYDTASSTAPASSPDPCEYTYEGAIQDYKQRVQRASSNNGTSNGNTKMNSTSNGDSGEPIAYPTRRGSKIEDRLSGFEVTSPSDTQEGVEKQPKVDVPKVDISKRKEIFEQANSQVGAAAPAPAPKLVLRDRLTNGNNQGSGAAEQPPPSAKQEVKRLSGDITSIRDRMQSLEQQRHAFNSSKSVDVPVPPLKQRLNSLQHAVTKEEQQKKPPLVALIDARQLEIMRGEEERMRQRQQQQQQQQQQTQKIATPTPISNAAPPPAVIIDEPPTISGNNDDSGIQEDNQEEVQQQQQQLNAAIAALALEERQLEEAANAVNQIEAEFDELTDLNPSPLPKPTASAKPTSVAAPSPGAPVPPPSTATTTASAPAPPLRDMEFSVSSTNNFIENARLSPRDVDVDVVPPTAASKVSVFKVSPPGPTNPYPLSHPNSNPYSPGNCNLRRKPSNEMIHHRNLLKMYNETFQNDEELKEETNDEPATSPSGQFSQVYDFTKLSNPPPTPVAPPTTVAVAPPTTVAVAPPTTVAAAAPTQIPRPLGKPPMSPKAVRQPFQPIVASSPTTPQQFSINGRVEIFNSRQLDKPRTPPAPPKRTVVRVVEPPTPSPPSPQPPTEVVMCAPPVTIVNPDELPKPNTVKQLSNCFSHTGNEANSTQAPSPAPPSPRPLPRSRIPQITPPASPKPLKRDFHKELPLLSQDVVDRSSQCDDYAPIVGQTKAIVHSPPARKTPKFLPLNTNDPLAPNDTLQVHPISPSEMPSLKLCPPNESSLFKLANSRPTSPTQVDIAFCQQFLEQEAPKNLEISPEDRQRLEESAIQEMPCDKIDVAKSPLPKATGYQSISNDLIKKCDGGRLEKEPIEELVPPPSQEDIALCAGLLDCLAPAQEPICDSIDVRKAPIPATGFKDVTEDEVRRCDKIIGSKPNSPPIGDARAAHSKALMETCEQIIAEERLASSQMMKSSLPTPTASTSTVAPSTPVAGRKSKIPIPKACCISASGTDSISRTGYGPANAEHDDDPSALIARTHLVQTEIKVTTPSATVNASPATPAPAAAAASSPPPPPNKEKKTKNIFDFLRRNFGHHEEKDSTTNSEHHHPTLNETLEPKVVLTSTRSGVDVLVNANDIKNEADKEIIQVDNSKFYVASNEAIEPPPLPKTPAPVNIEIRKTIRTDEILEPNTTEEALTQEISDMLDDEINKLEEVERQLVKN